MITTVKIKKPPNMKLLQNLFEHHGATIGVGALATSFFNMTLLFNKASGLGLILSVFMWLLSMLASGIVMAVGKHIGDDISNESAILKRFKRFLTNKNKKDGRDEEKRA